MLCKERKESILRLKLETLDTKLFHRLLSISVQALPPLPSSLGESDLDILAEGITRAAYNAYFGAAKLSNGHGKGNPWWDRSCKPAHQEYKS